MAANLAGRTILRGLPSRLSSASSSSSSLISSRLPSRIPISRIQTPSRIIRLRRESLVLSSMCPIHSAIASARLVSKLPTDASVCVEVNRNPLELLDNLHS